LDATVIGNHPVEAARAANRSTEDDFMGLGDKIENKTDDLKGKGKEAAGALTDDNELRSEGKTDQSKASVKDAGEKVKDAAGDVKDAFKK
jgi:uncharacterized protein YjbJ (UPF0337 family)